jgi:hypothetical protein
MLVVSHLSSFEWSSSCFPVKAKPEPGLVLSINVYLESQALGRFSIG